jgi:transposase
MKKQKPINPDEINVHSVLSDLKEGKINPEILNKEARQACVMAFMLEGHQASSIAALLKVSDKTIQRDIKELCAKNALEPNQTLARELVGEYLQKCRNHHAYLTRLARTKEASLQEKAQAEFLAVQTLHTMMKLLQSLGFLPQQPQQIVGDFFHHGQAFEEASLTELKQQMEELEEVLKVSDPPSEELLKKLEQLKLRCETAQIRHSVLQITQESHSLNEGENHES